MPGLINYDLNDLRFNNYRRPVIGDLNKLYIEREVLTGQRVIAINGDRFIGDFGDHQLHRLAVGRLALQLHTDFGLEFWWQGRFRNFLHELLVFLAIGLFGRNRDCLAVADFHAVNSVVKARNNLAAAERKLERFPA